MIRLGLRGRIMASMMLLTGLLIGGLSAAIYLDVRAERLRALDASLAERAAGIAGLIEHDEGQWELNAVDPAHPAVIGDADWFSVRALGTGVALWGSGPPPAVEDARVHRGQYAVHTEEEAGHRATRASVEVTIGQNTGVIDASMRRLLRAMIAFGGLAVIGSLTLGWRLAGSVVSAARFRQMQAAYERQHRFTANASHELRTPLSIVRSSAEVALRQARSPDQYRESLEVIQAAAERMQRLIDGLLWLARAAPERLRGDFGELDLRAPIGAALAGLQAEAAARGVSLSAALPGPIAVVGSPAQLEILVTNLVLNALQHSQRGGAVRVSLERDARGARLAVEDRGAGIPAVAIPDLFEPFFRADEARTRTRGGSGLGLSIVKTIADAHGAQVEITSEEGRGTLAVVRFPSAPRPIPQ